MSAPTVDAQIATDPGTAVPPAGVAAAGVADAACLSVATRDVNSLVAH
jgi:hypothetical protein